MCQSQTGFQCLLYRGEGEEPFHPQSRAEIVNLKAPINWDGQKQTAEQLGRCVSTMSACGEDPSSSQAASGTPRPCSAFPEVFFSVCVFVFPLPALINLCCRQGHLNLGLVLATGTGGSDFSGGGHRVG